MTHNPNRLLIIDDHADMLDFMAEVGEGLGFAISRAGDQTRFCSEYVIFEPTVIVLDLQMPGADGVELLRWLSTQRCKAALVLASGMDRGVLASTVELALTYGLNVAGSLQKPIALDTLEMMLLPLMINVRRFADQDVRRAVDRAQLRVHYQPKIVANSKIREIVGVEALLRWDHPEYGLVLPEEFIGIAERHGTIAALTDFVLQTGIEQLAAWDRAGFNTQLSVNLSPRLMIDVDFPDRLGDLLRGHGIAPQRITLETTETAAISEPQQTLDIFTRLRLKGIGLSLDDFGVGLSSLTQLYKLPYSEMKIDQSLGGELLQNARARTMVATLICLAHSLGLKVCCEGVEDSQALEFLAREDCDFAQGYLIARPMSGSSLADWAQQWSGAMPMRKAS